ncbi:MAG: ATP-binding protein [Deltaproteobacteria bacterium]|nr:ATP-binding protein [Deltaproteobacteria bacterium]
MSEPRWGVIAGASTFESLVTTLVYFEDANAKLFGRRGRDGGQDVRSGDDKTVYQAKFHEDATGEQAIRDAKSEALKIAQYRQAEHPRAGQWIGVERWCLVTNAVFNPTNEAAWRDEVAPLFSRMHLEAIVWTRATLEGLLTKHPEVERSYFGGQPRAVLSLPEAQERVALDLPFLPRATYAPLFGREDELAAASTFRGSGKTFLVVSGPGGVGKTRLLLEIGMGASTAGWQVLWANPASMLGGGWYTAIVPERSTLLLVDEPDDPQLLRQLVEQVGGRSGRANRWKVAVSVRSPKDPVVRFLHSPQMTQRRQDLPLHPVGHDAAERLCLYLLDSGPLSNAPPSWKEQTARVVASRYDRFPIWMSLAIELLEADKGLGEVPTTAQGLADAYLSEVLRSQDDFEQDQLLDVMRWIALLGPLNQQDEGVLDVVSKTTKVPNRTSLRACIVALTKRRALVQRGAFGRLVEVKPDVIKDHILRSWLLEQIGHAIARPSQALTDILAATSANLKSIAFDPVGHATLRSLARMEWLQRLEESPVSVLAPLFADLQAAAESLDARARIAVASALSSVADASPASAASLVHTLWTNPSRTVLVAETYGTRDITHNDVILALAWPLFAAATGARSDGEREVVLAELVQLVEAEEDIAPQLRYGLPNDGRRAGQLLERTLEGGPQFWSNFESEARAESLRLVAEGHRSGGLRPGQRRALRVLLKHLLSIERRQSFTEGSRFITQMFLISPQSPEWAMRTQLMGRVRDVIADPATPATLSETLWEILADSHASQLQGADVLNGPNKEILRAAALDDLQWAVSVLGVRQRSASELAAARNMWDWHRRFDKDPVFVERTQRLEEIFLANRLNDEFERLTSHDTYTGHENQAALKAADLLKDGDPASIEAFIGRAVEFFGSESLIHRLSQVAAEIGRRSNDDAKAAGFIRRGLADAANTARFQFTLFAARSWLRVVRTASSEAAAALLEEMLTRAVSPQARATLLLHVFGHYQRQHDGVVCAAEHRVLRARSTDFVQLGLQHTFLEAIGWSFSFEWESFQVIVEEIVRSASVGLRPRCIQQLAESIDRGLRQADDNEGPPSGLGNWLLEQLLRLHDPSAVGETASWYLEQILSRVGKPSVSWLLERLRDRIDAAPAGTGERGEVLPSRYRFSKFVSPLEADAGRDISVREKFEGFLRACVNHASLYYGLPQYVSDLDPNGVLAPDVVAAEVAKIHATGDQFWKWARLAAAYRMNSAPWRTIAQSVCIAASRIEQSKRRSIFSALVDGRSIGWHANVGEVPKVFTEAVDEARRLLADEDDPLLKPFWAWHLEVAEDDLREQVERAKEDRGE